MSNVRVLEASAHPHVSPGSVQTKMAEWISDMRAGSSPKNCAAPKSHAETFFSDSTRCSPESVEVPPRFATIVAGEGEVSFSRSAF